MSSKKPPALGDASIYVPLLTVTGLKASPDDALPLYADSRARARVTSSWKRVFLVVGSLCLISLLVHSTPLSCLHSSHRSEILRNPAYLITADHGAVAAENKRCSDIGVDVLKDGGSAIDAAISASFCTGVVNMFS